MTVVKLHSTEFGPADGFPVLAVHGWTPDHRLMTGCLEPVFSTRTKAYRRLYPDLPGMGETPVGEVESADDILDSLDAYVDEHIGNEPFLIIGESYGGYLARALTRKRRLQVAGLSLICPVGTAVWHVDRDVPPHEVLYRDDALEHLRGSEFDEVAVVQTPETFRRTQTEVVVGLDIADFPALDRIQHQWVLEEEPEDGESISVPTVIMAGRLIDGIPGLDGTPGPLSSCQFHGAGPGWTQPSDRAAGTVQGDNRRMARQGRGIAARSALSLSACESSALGKEFADQRGGEFDATRDPQLQSVLCACV